MAVRPASTSTSWCCAPRPAAAPPPPTGTLVAEASRRGDRRRGGWRQATDDEATASPTVAITDDDHDRATVEVSGATPGEPFWLVLGQSHNPGWTATVAGEALGEPLLVDGFANGWLVTPDAESFAVEMRFAPQRRVDIAIVHVGPRRAGVPGPRWCDGPAWS